MPRNALQHPGHDKTGLVVFILALVDRDGLAAVVIRPEFLALPALIVPDDGVGRVQNALGRAVVLLQTNHPGAGVVLLKVQNVLNRRAAEAIDALVVVADDAEVLVQTRQQPRQLELRAVGVLVLVHQHIDAPSGG